MPAAAGPCRGDPSRDASHSRANVN
jgi:hypothetical protein